MFANLGATSKPMLQLAGEAGAVLAAYEYVTDTLWSKMQASSRELSAGEHAKLTGPCVSPACLMVPASADVVM